MFKNGSDCWSKCGGCLRGVLGAVGTEGLRSVGAECWVLVCWWEFGFGCWELGGA